MKLARPVLAVAALAAAAVLALTAHSSAHPVAGHSIDSVNPDGHSIDIELAGHSIDSVMAPAGHSID